ncbi:MAG: putative RND superfamily exporter protein [Gammaproteobacteria bacterium]|jgi:predicted RND superfamily exporter protein
MQCSAGGAGSVGDSALLAGFFRAFRLGIISLLPNVFAALIAIAICTLTVGEIGVALASVVTMTVGIVVDDTVHFVSRFLHARSALVLSAESAVLHAFSATGLALVSTSVVLVLGFSVLTLSAFEVNHAMQQLTARVIVCALIADFLMLSGLLIAAARRGWV